MAQIRSSGKAHGAGEGHDGNAPPRLLEDRPLLLRLYGEVLLPEALHLRIRKLLNEGQGREEDPHEDSGHKIDEYGHEQHQHHER